MNMLNLMSTMISIDEMNGIKKGNGKGKRTRTNYGQRSSADSAECDFNTHVIVCPFVLPLHNVQSHFEN